MTAIAQDFVSDLAGPGVVDQHAADRGFPGNPPGAVFEHHDVAVFRQQNLRPRIAPREHTPGHARMLRQLTILAVDGHEIARPHEREHQLQLFVAAMAGDVHVLDPLVNDVRAAPREMIDHAADRFLVPGN